MGEKKKGCLGHGAPHSLLTGIPFSVLLRKSGPLYPLAVLASFPRRVSAWKPFRASAAQQWSLFGHGSRDRDPEAGPQLGKHLTFSLVSEIWS